MKRSIIHILVICIYAFSLASCGNNKSQTIQYLASQRDSLENVLNGRDSMVLAMNGYLGVIASSLDSIKVAEQIYTLTRDAEGNAISRDVIQDNLDLLKGVLKRQRERIEQLDSILKDTSDSVGYYRQLISYLYIQIDRKDEEIKQMKQDLENKDKTIKTLTTRVNTAQKKLDEAEMLAKEQSEMIGIQSEIMDLNQKIANTGYVLLASKKEMQSMGILSRGLKKSINYDKIDPSKFQKLDMRELTEIPLSSSSATILSAMPADSYKIERVDDGTVIKILDPGKFWSITLFLIIQI